MELSLPGTDLNLLFLLLLTHRPNKLERLSLKSYIRGSLLLVIKARAYPARPDPQILDKHKNVIWKKTPAYFALSKVKKEIYLQKLL
jgi:hypothetical protein